MKAIYGFDRYYLRSLGWGTIIFFLGSLFIPPALPIFVGGLFTLALAIDAGNKKGDKPGNGLMLLLTVFASVVLATLSLKGYCLVGLPSTSCKPSFFKAVLFVNLVMPGFILIVYFLLVFLKKCLLLLFDRQKK